MAFIDTTDANCATGDVRAMYERQQKSWGYVPNYAKLFSHRPNVLAAWAEMIAVIRAPVDARTFELVTFAAACALGSSSCSLAHARKLIDRFLSPDEVAAVASGRESETTLNAAEIAMVRFARKLVCASSSVEQRDIDTLRANGLNDARIFDIACIASGRAFFQTFWKDSAPCRTRPSAISPRIWCCSSRSVVRSTDSRRSESHLQLRRIQIHASFLLVHIRSRSDGARGRFRRRAAARAVLRIALVKR